MTEEEKIAELYKYKHAWNLLATVLHEDMPKAAKIIAASTKELMRKAEEIVGIPHWEERK